jgi:2-dehydropantoate 2-reductase
MRFVIVGPGALGSLVGAKLARRGHDVTLLGRRSPHLQALRRHGLQLETRDGTTEHLSIPATDDPSVVSSVETVLVLVKTIDTVAAIEAIRPYVRSDHVVLTLQNGLGNVEKIQTTLGIALPILVGVTSQAATRLGPGSVKHAGEGPTLVGYMDERHAGKATDLARVFSDANLPAVAVLNIDHWIWRKLAVNAAINGLTALGGFRNGMIASDDALLHAAEIIAEEVASVARGTGIELGAMRRVILETAGATADNKSSMLQDLDASRPTEVDAIHGAVLAAGTEVGVATPAIQVIASLIRAKEKTMANLEHVDGP